MLATLPIIEFPECNGLPAGRRKICRCETDITFEKINAYRVSWGLAPLQIDPRKARPATRFAARPATTQRPRKTARPASRFWQSLTPACGFLGALRQQEPCSCGSSLKIDVHECRLLKTSRGTPKLCVLSGERHSLIRDESLRRAVQCCASCPHRSPPRWISLAKFQEDTRRLMTLLPEGITAIAGHARSGLLPATQIAMSLHLPLWIIRSHHSLRDVVPAGNGWRLDQGSPQNKGGILAVIDDNVMTGNSLTRLRPVVYPWAERQGFARVVEAVVYCNPLAEFQPDIVADFVPWPSYYEHNFFNSTFSPGFALDFDGILCRDCRPDEDDDGPRYLEFLRTAAPLHLPRREPVSLIVTGRREKYRGETLRWLERHGVTVRHLVMHPDGPRSFESIVSLKAQHFRGWRSRQRPNLRIGPPMFVESDARQAHEIARQSGGLVICPATSEVMQG